MQKLERRVGDISDGEGDEDDELVAQPCLRYLKRLHGAGKTSYWKSFRPFYLVFHAECFVLVNVVGVN